MSIGRVLTNSIDEASHRVLFGLVIDMYENGLALLQTSLPADKGGDVCFRGVSGWREWGRLQPDASRHQDTGSVGVVSGLAALKMASSNSGHSPGQELRRRVP